MRDLSRSCEKPKSIKEVTDNENRITDSGNDYACTNVNSDSAVPDK